MIAGKQISHIWYTAKSNQHHLSGERGYWNFLSLLRNKGYCQSIITFLFFSFLFTFISGLAALRGKQTRTAGNEGKNNKLNYPSVYSLPQWKTGTRKRCTPNSTFSVSIILFQQLRFGKGGKHFEFGDNLSIKSNNLNFRFRCLFIGFITIPF